MLFAIIGLGRKDGCPRLALTLLLLSVQRDPPPPGLTLVELLRFPQFEADSDIL